MIYNLFTNKYYVMICGVYILQQLYGAMLSVGIYFMTYVLHNKNLFGVFSWAINIPLIIGLLITPYLVKKFNGMYKIGIPQGGALSALMSNVILHTIDSESILCRL